MLHTNMQVWGLGPVVAGAVPKFNRPDKPRVAGTRTFEDVFSLQ